MSIQSKFRTFDESIKLKRFDENAELREKRDRILTRIREGLARQFPQNTPTFQSFNQGSYEMGTGIKPLDGDYDIDVGLVFQMEKGSLDPLTMKGWVHKAVDGHTSLPAQFRRPCVTVQYVEGGRPKFHVDLAVYAKADSWGGPYLAMGKQNSGADQKSWVKSDPQELTKLVAGKFNGDDGSQFRRVIRYLKRWKDFHFASEGQAAPRGIALTACAYKWFVPIKGSMWGSNAGQYDDLAATKRLVAEMINIFSWSSRLSVNLPVPPGNDLFKRMSDQQMAELKRRLDRLYQGLSSAESSSEATAAAQLRTLFGTDFPA